MAAPEVMAAVTRAGKATPPPDAVFWAFTGWDSDASTLGTIIAGVSGKRHYITHATLTGGDADALPQLQDEDDVLLFGPVAGMATGFSTMSRDFPRPIMMGVDKDLELKAAAAGAVSFYVEGYTAN